MSDDATSGQWDPPADQPVVPEPARETPPASTRESPPEPTRESPPEPSWAAPAFGPPPKADPPTSDPAGAPMPPSVFNGPQASGGFVYPDGAQSPYRVDYLESRPRRRSPALIIASVLVVLALVGSGFGLLSSSTGHSTSGVAGVPSASASESPHPPDSTTPQNSTVPSPAPSGDGVPLPSTDSGPLDSYLLPPTDIGAGALMALIPGGRSVSDQATLDFCNFDYTSENLRSARVQVQYVGSGQSASNEFVRYRSGGAAAAFSELQKAIAGCPSSYNESGGQVSNIHRLSDLSGLAKNSAAVSFTSTFTGIGGVVHEATTVVYQFDGDYFSGVYVYGTDAAAVQSAAAKLGAASAKLLAEAAAGKPGTGGGPLANPQPSEPGIQA